MKRTFTCLVCKEKLTLTGDTSASIERAARLWGIGHTHTEPPRVDMAVREWTNDAAWRNHPAHYSGRPIVRCEYARADSYDLTLAPSGQYHLEGFEMVQVELEPVKEVTP